MPKKSWSLVTEGVYLYTSREVVSGAHVAVYEVECTLLKALSFEVDISLSQNFKIDGTADTKVQVQVGPFQRTRVAQLAPVDASRRSVLKVQYRWSLSDLVVPEDQIRRDTTARDEAVEQLLRKVTALRLGDMDGRQLSVDVVQERCVEGGVLFVDPSFAPTTVRLRQNQVRGRPITWKRPSEFMDGAFAVFDAGVEPADIRQGSLADCWLQCALAGLAEFPELVENLFVDSPTVSRAGVYSVRLCRSGIWRTIILDDYFPCFAGSSGGPVYSRNHGNELWVMLLEKAFAKSFGSFSAMRFGWSYEAMIDLTGSPFRTIRLHDEEILDEISSGLLWDTLVDYDTSGYLISATTPGEDIYSEQRVDEPEADFTAGIKKGPNGLVSGHAYTVLTATETSDGQHRLLKLRNPWGNFEWLGDWGDNSSLWTPELREELGALAVVDDGTFWMSFDDVCKYFYSVNVSMVAPWEVKRCRTHFVFPADQKQQGSHCVPPMYVLSVTRTSKVFLSLHQQDIREDQAPPYVDMAITILRVLPDYTFDLVASSGACVERQVQVEATLTEGRYVVVGCTTGCKYTQYSCEPGNVFFDDETAGLVQPDSIRDTSSQRLLDETRSSLTAPARAAFAEVFSRLDEDLDGVLNYAELDRYMQLTENCALDEKVFRWMLCHFDSSDQGLTMQGFLEAQLYMCVSTGGDETTLMNDLMFMGYTRNLKLSRAKSVTLVLHSDSEVVLRAQPFDCAAYEEALELPVRRLGVCKEYENGEIKLYTYKCGYTGVCIAVENCSSSRVLSMDINASQCRNVVSSRESMLTTDTVPPGTFKILHYLMMRETGDWSWTFEDLISWSLTIRSLDRRRLS